MMSRRTIIAIILSAVVLLSVGSIIILRQLQNRVGGTNIPSQASEGSAPVVARTPIPRELQDYDRDGITDVEELRLGISPRKRDTDGDGLNDKGELNLGTDPKVADFSLEGKDTDGDGLPDALEVRFKLDPSKIDADGDGFDDYDELETMMSGEKDVDNDGLSDKEEEFFGTDPKNPDTDGDGFKDGVEVQGGYNPKGPGKL